MRHLSPLILNARFLMRPPTGVDRVAMELARALIAQAPGRVQALRPSGPVVAPDTRPRALLDVIRTVPSRLTGALWEQVALPRALPRDAVLLSLCNSGPILWRRQIALIHDAQVHTAPESYTPAFRAWYRWMQPRLARRTARVVTVSQTAARDLAAQGIAPRDRISVIPNGADHILRVPPDPGTLARHNLTPGGYLLAVGSTARHKNLPFLDRAHAQANIALPLVVAGGGGAHVFARAGLPPRPGLRILGRVPDAELRALYTNARALAFPSLTEGFGLPPLEAMTCGCPVLASDIPALRETCGRAALFCAPENEDAWARVLTRLTRDDALCARLRDKGLTRARRFTWSASARQLLQTIETARTAAPLPLGAAHPSSRVLP